MRRKIKQGLILLGLMAVILWPLLLLGLWTVVARWPYPNLWPTAFSLRGLKQLHTQWGQVAPVLGQSFLLSLGVGLLSLVISLLNARFYVQTTAWGRRWLSMLMFLPMLIPATVFGMGIHTPFLRLGLANTIPGVLLVHLLYSLPYANFLVCEAYQNIGLGLEEEAQTLGASPFQAFRLVTLPLLAPVLLTAMVMAYIVSFSQYFLTLLIGGGVVRTYALIMYPYLQANDRTIASVFSLIFLLFTCLVFALGRFLVRWCQRHLLQREALGKECKH